MQALSDKFMESDSKAEQKKILAEMDKVRSEEHKAITQSIEQAKENSPRLKALHGKLNLAISQNEMKKIEAEISKETDSIINSIFESARDALAELPAPTYENVPLRDDRHTYYDMKGKYTLMFSDKKAWVKSGSSSKWCWLVDRTSKTYQPQHITLEQFSNVLKTKPSYSQLESQFQIYIPTTMDFSSAKESGDYKMMSLFFSDDERNVKRVFIK